MSRGRAPSEDDEPTVLRQPKLDEFGTVQPATLSKCTPGQGRATSSPNGRSHVRVVYTAAERFLGRRHAGPPAFGVTAVGERNPVGQRPTQQQSNRLGVTYVTAKVASGLFAEGFQTTTKIAVQLHAQDPELVHQSIVARSWLRGPQGTYEHIRKRLCRTKVLASGEAVSR